jgi:hypothetical protein
MCSATWMQVRLPPDGDQVADRVHALDRRAQELVGDDEAPFDANALLLVAEVGRRRSPPDRDEQQLGLERLAAVERDPHAVVGALDLLEPGAQLEADAAPAEGPLELLGIRVVLEWDEVGQRLDDRHLGAERRPGRRELAADDAAAQHDRRLGHPVELQGVLAGDDPLAVEVQARQRARVGTGREDQVRAGVAVVADLHRLRPGQVPLAVDDVDAATLDEAGEALPVLRDDAVLVLVHAGHVDALEGGIDAERRALAGLIGDLAGVQQRLGGDATAVQAGAADLVLLDQYDGFAEFGRPQRGRVAAASAAEDDEVGLVVCHRCSRLVRRVPSHLGTTPRTRRTDSGSPRVGAASGAVLRSRCHHCPMPRRGAA